MSLEALVKKLVTSYLTNVNSKQIKKRFKNSHSENAFKNSIFERFFLCFGFKGGGGVVLENADYLATKAKYLN